MTYYFKLNHNGHLECLCFNLLNHISTNYAYSNKLVNCNTLLLGDISKSFHTSSII